MNSFPVLLFSFLVTVAVVSASFIPKSFEAIKPFSLFGSISSQSKQWAAPGMSSSLAQPVYPTHQFISKNIKTNVGTAPQSAVKAHPLAKYVSRYQQFPPPGMTVYMKYYLPVDYKCDPGFYCRAEMTVYQEFEGRTVIEVGYSVWYFNAQNVPIPSNIRKAILGTSDSETWEYIEALNTVMVTEYPYMGSFCHPSYYHMLEVFRRVYDAMGSCSYTDGMACERSETVTKC